MLHRTSICLSCNNLSAPLLATIRPPHNTQSQLTVGWLEERRGGGLELMDDYGIQRTSTKEAEAEEEERRGYWEEQDRDVEKTTD